MGIVLPTAIANIWNDASGGFVWAALIARVFTWHTTFIVNSLAHWRGLQPYSDESTARGNLLFALLTCGEGNHNFHHAFPFDYRATPLSWDWDPSKWMILLLERTGQATKLRQASKEDVQNAQIWMKSDRHDTEDYYSSDGDLNSWAGPCWSVEDLKRELALQPGRHLIHVDEYILDVSSYLKDHPGGTRLLTSYSLRLSHLHRMDELNATEAFHGGVNNHSRIAKRKMKKMRVASLVSI